MIEPRTASPMIGVDRIAEMSDLDLTIYYENERTWQTDKDIYVITNDASSRVSMWFKFIPLRTLLEVMKDNWHYNSDKKINELDTKEILNTIDSKISGMKWGQTKINNTTEEKINILKERISKLEKLLESKN